MVPMTKGLRTTYLGDLITNIDLYRYKALSSLPSAVRYVPLVPMIEGQRIPVFSTLLYLADLVNCILIYTIIKH